ncbi:MAG: Gfo/Idh/MocA family oxidoreductase [bacterium]|nr:Gfo/Idh/MocA family oxidoreductase [bacterium]
MIKTGIIGFGKMGKIRAEAVEADGRGTIVSVFDANSSEDFLSYNVAGSAEDIINDPSIDTVFICTPNYLNKPLTIAALEQGKHVFCEKPPAFNAAEIEEIREVEKMSQKKLMYGFNHRHHSSIRHMKNLVESKEYGDILWMRGRYGKSVDNRFFETWRAKKDLAGGGILLDQGIHMLDLFLYLGEDFDEVHAFVSNLYWKLEIEDNVFAIFRNSQRGIVASLHSTMTQWRHLFSLEVFMERGYMVLNGLKTSSGTYGDESLSIARNRTSAPAATWEDEERITYHTNTSWRSEVDHFFSGILNGGGIKIGNSNDALKLMRIMDKIYECK